jgi:hypothetical protein
VAATVERIGNGAVDESAPGQTPDPVLETLRIVEALVARTRRAVDQALCRVQLRLHAWQTARDPETMQWLDETRRAIKDGTAQKQASTREDILRAMEKAAGQH